MTARFCLGIFLLLQAILDGRTRYVSMSALALQTAVGLGTGCLRDVSGEILWSRFLPGLLILAISCITKEKVGRGDGWLFVALGVYLTAEQQLLLLCGAAILASLWTVLLFCRGRVDKSTTVAFVPFVLAAYVGGCFYGCF